MAVNEILWGTGVDNALIDLARGKWSGRKPRVKVRKSFVRLVDPRRTSGTLVGTQAAALTLGRNGDLIVVKGAVDLQGVAAAVWDVAPPTTSISWGRKSLSGVSSLEGYSINSAGDLYFHPSIQVSNFGIKMRWNSWFMSLTVPSGGQLILSRQKRVEKIQEAQKHGVEVNPQSWSKLLDSSRKFLVPE